MGKYHFIVTNVCISIYHDSKQYLQNHFAIFNLLISKYKKLYLKCFEL